ncbi:MAG: GNAT family N-acetyltransferase [Caldilineaceae bacterium]|nr:GNAT family N-acetyltransferase [Caldilineaceae bacterium]
MHVETERLKLIPLSLEGMQLLLDDYQRLEKLLGLPQTEQTLARRLRPVISHNISFVKNAPEYHIWYTYWIMLLKSEQRLIGGCGFKGPADERGEVEIGYGTDDAFRNRGFMSEAVAGMVQWALAQPGVCSVCAETANTNVASMRVLQKVGFTPFRATDRYLYWRFREEAREKERRPDEFELYDLSVIVEEINGNCTCNMRVGDAFYLRRSSSLSLPEGGHFCIWALNSVLPLLAARQRINHPADWIETDSRVTCPDPACGLIMRIDRLDKQILKHDEVSPIPWEHDRWMYDF